MNWAQVLSEFPRSILENELPMQTLAILERIGLATEEELADYLGVELGPLKHVLLALKMNRCIEYGRNYVTLTTRGKLLVDRFDLKESIIDDLLDSVDLKGKERLFCKHVIVRYRDEAFKNYLNSLGTIRIWKNMAENLSDPLEDEKTEAEENKLGMLTLLLRDLRNWFQHSGTSTTFSKKFDSELKDSLSSIRILDNKQQRFLNKRKLDTCRVLLNSWEQGDWDPALWNKAKINEKKALLLVDFYMFQANTGPDNWFDLYWDKKMQLESGEEIKDDISILLVNNNFLKSKKKVSLINKQLKFANETYHKNWAISDLPTLQTEDLFTSIMLCVDLQDLIRRSGYKQSVLKYLLKELSVKCEELLNDRESALST